VHYGAAVLVVVAVVEGMGGGGGGWVASGRVLETIFFYFIFVVPRIVLLGGRNPTRCQQYADIYLLLNYSTCFGRPSRPSSGVHKTVVVASGTDHTIWAESVFRRGQISPYLVTFDEACSPYSLICTRGCKYSFIS